MKVPNTENTGRRLSRRDFLKFSALSSAAFLAACGYNPPEAGPDSTPVNQSELYRQYDQAGWSITSAAEYATQTYDFVPFVFQTIKSIPDKLNPHLNSEKQAQIVAERWQDKPNLPLISPDLPKDEYNALAAKNLSDFFQTDLRVRGLNSAYPPFADIMNYCYDGQENKLNFVAFETSATQPNRDKVIASAGIDGKIWINIGQYDHLRTLSRLEWMALLREEMVHGQDAALILNTWEKITKTAVPEQLRQTFSSIAASQIVESHASWEVTRDLNPLQYIHQLAPGFEDYRVEMVKKQRDLDNRPSISWYSEEWVDFYKQYYGYELLIPFMDR